MNAIDPRLAFVSVIRELRRVQQMALYRLDSVVIQQAKQIEMERCRAFTAHERYAPDEELP